MKLKIGWNNQTLLTLKIIFSGQEEDQTEAKEFLIKAFFVSFFSLQLF